MTEPDAALYPSDVEAGAQAQIWPTFDRCQSSPGVPTH